MLPKLKCHKILKCPKNPNLSHNKNPGDRHRSPWSCVFLVYMFISLHLKMLSGLLYAGLFFNLSKAK